MKQKKLLCAFLAATVALGLTACNLGQSGKTQEASYPITVGTANLAQQPDFVVLPLPHAHPNDGGLGPLGAWATRVRL